MKYINNNSLQSCGRYIRRLLLATLWIGLFSSCEYFTFRQTNSGLYYRPDKEKRNAQKPKNGDMLTLDVRYQTSDDPKDSQLLFDSRISDEPFCMEYITPLKKEEKGGIIEGIHMLAKGERITCKIPAKRLLGDKFEEMAKQYNLKKGTYIYVYLHLKNITPKSEFDELEAGIYQAAEKKQFLADKVQLPKDIAALDAYLKEHNIEAETLPSGLRYVIEKRGQGGYPRSGNIVHINYVGRTMDGVVFDTNVAEVAKAHNLYHKERSYQPFKFIVGEGQVIAGFDEGVRAVERGGKIQLFIPSVLAYKGADLGIIKPNSNLIFEVEIVNIEYKYD